MTEMPLSENPQYQFYKDKIIENTGTGDWEKNGGFYTKMFKEYRAVAVDDFKIIEIIGNFNAEMEMGKASDKVISNPGAYLNKCLQNGLKALKESQGGTNG